MSFRALISLFSLGVLLTPAAAQATPIAFDFTVRVTSLQGTASALFPTLAVGDLITGRYSSDTALVDGAATPTLGSYAYNSPVAPFSTYVDINGQRLSWSGSRIGVLDTAVLDVYLFNSEGVFSPFQGLTTASFTAQFNGGPGGTFTNDLFPVVPPDPSIFRTTPFTLYLGPDTGPNKIAGTVTALAVATPTVPEPASLLLFGLGLTAGAARLRRRR